MVKHFYVYTIDGGMGWVQEMEGNVHERMEEHHYQILTMRHLDKIFKQQQKKDKNDAKNKNRNNI